MSQGNEKEREMLFIYIIIVNINKKNFPMMYKMLTIQIKFNWYLKSPVTMLNKNVFQQ